MTQQNTRAQKTEATSQQGQASLRPEFALQLALGTLFFFLVCLTASDSIKQTAIYVLLTTLGLGLVQQNKLLPRLSLPMIPLLAWVSLSGISIFYALAKKFALLEFLGLLLPFCLLVLLLLLCKTTQRITGVLVIATTWISFLSIDLISTRIFTNAFAWFLGFFTQAYMNMSGVEVGVRMTSILRNPNVYGGCAGIAVLLALGLSLHTKEKILKNLYLTCLFINALGFLLAFSMGATATILLGFFAYLLWEEKEKKLPLFLLMVETLLLSVAAAFPIFLTSFTAWETINWVPLGCTLLGSVLLVMVDSTLGKGMVSYFQEREKQSKIFFAFVVGSLALYATLAVTVTNSYTLSSGETLRRSAYPDPGTYSLSLDATADLSVTIHSQNREETMMHSNTVLYQGTGEDISFTVPEDSEVIYVSFKATEETTLHTATLSSGTSLDLNYPLLPGFIANRLQGLLANQNAIQRTVFFEDGMKLFSVNPLFGLGMGSFENALFTVQSFYYETDYVHNHYIQMLLETGILGLIFYVSTLLTFFVGLWKAQKQQVPLATSTLAVLVFISTHAMVELVWSTSFYLMIAFGVFAVMLTQVEALSSPQTTADNSLEEEQSSMPLELSSMEKILQRDDSISPGCPDVLEDNFTSSTQNPKDVLLEEMAWQKEGKPQDYPNNQEDYIEILEEGDPLAELSFQEAPPVATVHEAKDRKREHTQESLETELPPKNPLSLGVFRLIVVGLSIFTLLLYGNIKARELVTSSSREDFIPAVVRATKMDVFETQDYWVSYLDSIHEETDPAVHMMAEEYIKKLEQISSNSIPMFIAKYYLSQNNIPKAVDALEDYVSYVISKSEYWNLAYRNLLIHFSPETAEDILAGISRLEIIRETWNEENMGTITLDDDVSEILALLKGELS